MTNIMEVIDAIVAKMPPPVRTPDEPRNPYLNARGVFSDPVKGREWTWAQTRERHAREDALRMKVAAE